MTTELERGMRIEAEHNKTLLFIRKYYKKHGKLPPDRLVYKLIAKDHIREFKNYYKKLKEAGL